MENTLLILIITVAIATVINVFLKRFDIPTVIGDLIVDAEIAKGEEAIFFANAAQKMVLSHFNVNDCTSIIVTIENEIQRQLICENIASFNPEVNSIAKVNNSAEEEVISELGIKHIVNGREIIADMLAEEALACHLNLK